MLEHETQELEKQRDNLQHECGEFRKKQMERERERKIRDMVRRETGTDYGWYGGIPSGYEDTIYVKMRLYVEHMAKGNLSVELRESLSKLGKLFGKEKCSSKYILHCEAAIPEETGVKLVLSDPYERIIVEAPEISSDKTGMYVGRMLLVVLIYHIGTGKYTLDQVKEILPIPYRITS